MSTVISVENLSKSYRLGMIGGATLKEDVNRWWAQMRGKEDPTLKIGEERKARLAGDDFKALDEVNFEVKQGELLGIIGRNGAGKSTLLKILSRITAPTSGEVKIRGRIASLLEVGTGFHPELTGRENVFLNGAILGMSKAEIRKNFDEIIAFSGIEEFIDTPVKRYSSGMYVRLAFAVAAHLEPEILIVDEVLAVGDAAFQKKCLEKMEDAGNQGRTVLFVSHNMPAVTRLCRRGLLLGNGRILKDGSPQQVATVYLTASRGTTAQREWSDCSTAPGNKVVRLRAVRVIDQEGHVTAAFDIRRPIGIQVEFDILSNTHALVPNFTVVNEDGICVCHPHDWASNDQRRQRCPGRYERTSWIPGNLMAEGTFVVGMAISSYDPLIVHVHEREVVAFQVIDANDGTSARGAYGGAFPGVVRPLLQWTDGNCCASASK
jgi:lipopolysaccharide transport system ATP-binding protein